MADDDATPREDVHEDGPQPEARPPPADEVAAALVARFPGSTFVRSHGQPVVYVDRSQWRDVAAYLRDEERITQCVDVTAVDHLVDVERLVPRGVSAERYEVV